MITLPYLNDMRQAFVAHLADRLSAQVCTETAELFEKRGIQTPIRSASALLNLYRSGPATLAEMARTDGQSHQLLTTRIAPLEGLGLVRRTIDASDARRRPYELTKRGLAEARHVELTCADIAAAMQDLFDETGVDLTMALDAAMEALRLTPLESRFSQAKRRTANG